MLLWVILCQSRLDIHPRTLNHFLVKQSAHSHEERLVQLTKNWTKKILQYFFITKQIYSYTLRNYLLSDNNFLKYSWRNRYYKPSFYKHQRVDLWQTWCTFKRSSSMHLDTWNETSFKVEVGVKNSTIWVLIFLLIALLITAKILSAFNSEALFPREGF